MEITYNRVALQNYMEDMAGVGTAVSQIRDESIHQYNACKQQYTKLHTELEKEVNRRSMELDTAQDAYNDAVADYEMELSMATYSDDENENATSGARVDAAYARMQAARWDLERAEAAYREALANLRRLTDIGDRYVPEADSTVNHIEEGRAALANLTANSNRDMEAYMLSMDRAQNALYEEVSAGGLSSAGASASAGAVSGGVSAPGSIGAVSGTGTQGSAGISGSTGMSGNAAYNTYSGVTASGAPSQEYKSPIQTTRGPSGEALVAMCIAGTMYTYPNTRSGLAKAYRFAMSKGDTKMAEAAKAMAEGRSVSIPTQPGVLREDGIRVVYSENPNASMNARSFGDDNAAAQKWCRDNFKNKLTSAERRDVQTYTGMGYEYLNKPLYMHTSLTLEQQEMVKNMDSAISRNTLKEDVVVYRAVDAKAMKSYLQDRPLQKHDTLSFAAYSSTSVCSNNKYLCSHADKDYILKLTAQSGTHAASVEEFTNVPGEYELIFGRNSQVYVTGVYKGKRSDISKDIDIAPNKEIVIIEGILC